MGVGCLWNPYSIGGVAGNTSPWAWEICGSTFKLFKVGGLLNEERKIVLNFMCFCSKAIILKQMTSK